MNNKSYVNSSFYKVAETDANDQVTGLVSGNLTVTATAQLGSVGNVKITGGSADYVLTTDGTGNLSWTQVTTPDTPPAGGNSQVQFNDNGAFGAEANFFYDTLNNTLSADRFRGDAGLLANIQAGNIVGVVANAQHSVNSNVAGLANAVYGSNVIGSVGSAGYAAVAGKVSEAAQPNITSVGTLINLNTNLLTVLGPTPLINLGNESNIRALNGTLFFQDSAVQISNTAFVSPGANNAGSLGAAAFRWANVVANTGDFTGNVSAAALKTDNLYYANGQPWDLQQPAGSNTQIQYNKNNDFGASAAFTFNDGSNTLTVSGNISAGNANVTGSMAVSGNISAGNINTGIINRTAYKSGELIKMHTFRQNGINQAETTNITSFTPQVIAWVQLQPTVANSVFVATYDCQWEISGTASDSWGSALRMNSIIMASRQQLITTSDGQRSSMLFPLSGSYPAPGLGTANINITAARISSDDTLTITNTTSLPATLTVWEIAP